jgi:hypothetical protein
LSLSLGVAAVSLLAIWMISPRFDIDVVSLVDDWAAYFYSPDQIADVFRLQNPETERFRPGVIVWGYLQWHTFGAPESLVGPNVWNVLRLAILVGGLTLFTALALPVRRGRLELVLYVGLASIPAFVVVLVPKFARDIARFGPQEPLLIGGMALGGSLLFLAAGALLAGDRPLRTLSVAVVAVFGAVTWALGVYQKELSICVLPILAAVGWEGRAQLRAWGGLSRGRKLALAVIAAVVALPLLHVAIETLRILQRGDLVYEEQTGDRGIASVQVLWDWAHEAVPENARLLCYGAVALTVIASVVRRRIDTIAVGILVSGVLTFVYAGLSGVVATRYYIPIVALFAVAFAISLARLPTPIVAAGVLAVFFSFMPPSGTRDDVRAWVDEELAAGVLVQEVVDQQASGCTVAVAGLDLEASAALPVAVGVTDAGPAKPCAPGEAVLVVGPHPEGAGLTAACVESALEPLVESPVGTVYRCAELRPGDEPARLVERNRLEPVVSG